MSQDKEDEPYFVPTDITVPINGFNVGVKCACGCSRLAKVVAEVDGLVEHFATYYCTAVYKQDLR